MLPFSHWYILVCLMGVVCGSSAVIADGPHGPGTLKKELEPQLALKQQCFWWTLNQSIARDDFEFPLISDGSRGHAKKGDLIPLQCDSAICPNPRVPNCYMDDGVCGADEWCLLEDHIKHGPFAITAEGETPNVAYQNCDFFHREGFDWIFKETCRGEDHWGPWYPMRGRCVKYRTEQQSCSVVWGPSLSPEKSKHIHPQYFVNPKTGRPPARPLVCGPGLVCTGEVEPIPYTCVKARPPNVCYQGPWWDSSSWCKNGGVAGNNNKKEGGLTQEELEEVAQALLVQLPTEVYGNPTNPRFWQDSAADTSRELIQTLLKTLWPASYRKLTKFPLQFPDPRAAGPLYSKGWNETARRAHVLYRQANKVWSTIHTLIHNTDDPLSVQQVEASRGIAVWLRHHFMCCNCRGFWSQDVLNAVGLPPVSRDREDHKFWWWRSHNMVSEHAAATRGGHPWVYPPMTDADFATQYGKLSAHLRCQNPWFLAREHADGMWKIRESSEESNVNAYSAV
eukprot:jgi/Botrbrau1/21767/Bobra.43_1s0157.1